MADRVDEIALDHRTLLILAAIAAHPMHGYGIRRAVDQISSGRDHLSVGTVYATLHRLVTDGLVCEAGGETVNGRHRRYYLLTDSGAVVLDAEIHRLRSYATHAAGQLGARHAL
jgi:PadR family transcriptional regulator PadR